VKALHFETASRVAQEIQDQGERAIAFKADVSQRAEVQDLVEKTLETFGNIHILVNNVGGMGPGPIPILEITDEDWYGIINSNLTSVFLGTQAVLGHMIKRQYGKIINISSLAAFGYPGVATYGSAKAGVIAFTKVTAREVGRYGINVNCIALGCVITDKQYARLDKEAVEKFIEESQRLTVLNRIGSPEDIACLAFFLASEESSYMTEQVITMDGGRFLM